VHCGRERHSVCYSATWPVWVKSDGIVPIMARPFLPNVCVANYDFAKNQQFATHSSQAPELSVII
jgi:hypothetical protein